MEDVTENNNAAKISKANLIALLIFQIVLLVPWAVIAALSGMGFDSGFSWSVVILLLPLWLFPFLIIICGIFCIRSHKQHRYKQAKVIMTMPIAVSFGSLLLYSIIGAIATEYFV